MIYIILAVHIISLLIYLKYEHSQSHPLSVFDWIFALILAPILACIFIIANVRDYFKEARARR